MTHKNILVKHPFNTYYLKLGLFFMFFLVFGSQDYIEAQGMIQTKIKSKVRRKAYEGVNTLKTSATMKAKGSKRALKNSLRGGKGGLPYNTDPTLDELIEDPELKAELYDNNNKKRYVELLGEWTTMPSDAEILARAQLKRIKDSLANIDRAQFRVTKNIWDDSRPMIVYGWHPHWMGEIYKGYDYGLFNVISYYSYDINPDDGSPQNSDVMAGFLGSEFVKTAQDKGCAALLSVTCHGESNVMRFLDQNDFAQQRFMDSILYILDSTNADGIEINFEGVNEATKDNFFKFVRILSTTVTGARGDTSYIFLTVPTYDPDNVYDIAKLQNFVDIFVVKGFNFHETPDGLEKMPPAPLNYSTMTAAPDLRSSVDRYIANLGPLYSDRLVLTLPYFGTMWLTDDIRQTVKEVSSITYGDIMFNFVMQKDNKERFPGAKVYYDSIQTSYIFHYKMEDYDPTDDVDSLDVTIYYDDSLSLLKKYRYLIDARLGGVGVQFLGNDSGFDHLEQLLSDEFTTIVMPEEDLLADVNAKSTSYRQNSIYILAVLLYLSIFLAIGFCAALFNKQVRQALFDSGRFRLMYMASFTVLMLLLGGYMGLFEGASLPLLVGVVFGSVMSWIGWRMVTKQKSLTP